MIPEDSRQFCETVMEETKLRIVAGSLLAAVIIVIIIADNYLEPSWFYFTILGMSGIAIFGISTWYIMEQLKLSRNKKQTSKCCQHSFKKPGELTKFRYEDVKLATNDFCTIIGKGGAGSVFMGMLKDGTYVSVKRIEGQGHGERGFRAEMAAIGCVRHRNLVRLYGYCVVLTGPRFLVYEFVSNGSLDRWIFGQRRNYDQPNGCLPWKLRYKISIEVAKALHYLHNDRTSRSLHLDVKPENILLDKDFRAVVSDFGLAKLMGKEENMVVTRVRGTRDYLAPELFLDNGVSVKSDVYSFGMVLLEIIGGRRNVCITGSFDQGTCIKSFDMMSLEYFPKIVFEKLKAEKLVEIVDKRLLEKGIVDEDELKGLASVALWCIQVKVILRPSMVQVIDMLEGRLPVNEPPEIEMFFLDLL